VSTDPMHDGKAHEYGHRNERHEALQMGVVQQPGGTHEHVKNNENPKQSIRYSRLIANGCCLARPTTTTLVTAAVIILAIVPAASIASSGDHLYRINPQRGSKSCPKKFMRSVSTQAMLFRLRLLALLETVAVGCLSLRRKDFLNTDLAMRCSRRRSIKWALFSSLVKFAPMPLTITMTRVRSSISSQ